MRTRSVSVEPGLLGSFTTQAMKITMNTLKTVATAGMFALKLTNVQREADGVEVEES